jgi:hypothetical protein
MKDVDQVPFSYRFVAFVAKSEGFEVNERTVGRMGEGLWWMDNR